MNSLQSSCLHENIQSLIKKLTFFCMGVLCRRKIEENSQKSLVFVKKIVPFHDKLCFKALKITNSSLRFLLFNKIG